MDSKLFIVKLNQAKQDRVHFFLGWFLSFVDRIDEAKPLLLHFNMLSKMSLFFLSLSLCWLSISVGCGERMKSIGFDRFIAMIVTDCKKPMMNFLFSFSSISKFVLIKVITFFVFWAHWLIFRAECVGVICLKLRTKNIHMICCGKWPVTDSTINLPN